MKQAVPHPYHVSDVREKLITSEDSPQNLRNLQQILQGRFDFRAQLPISKRSYYGDVLWDLRDPDNPRLVHYSPSQLIIDWKRILEQLGWNSSIVEDLKKFAFVRYAYSREIYGTLKNAHPATLVGEIRILVQFLSHVLRTLSREAGFSLVENLSDITVEDWESARESYGFKLNRNLRTPLKCLGSPVLGQFLAGGPLQWTPEDIGTHDWASDPKDHMERLPNGVFRLLSNGATTDVKQFLWALLHKTADATVLGEGENKFLHLLPDFPQLFEEYVNHNIALTTWRKAPDSTPPQDPEDTGLPVRPKEQLDEVIERVQLAAQTIIVLYTGARLSEFTSFKTGCLIRDGDEWVLRGTVLKKQDINSPAFRDNWVAIPIVRDAVSALQEICRLTANQFLFTAGHKHAREFPMKSLQVRRNLTRYLRLADDEGRWQQISIHAQQFRETLPLNCEKEVWESPSLLINLSTPTMLSMGASTIRPSGTAVLVLMLLKKQWRMRILRLYARSITRMRY